MTATRNKKTAELESKFDKKVCVDWRICLTIRLQFATNTPQRTENGVAPAFFTARSSAPVELTRRSPPAASRLQLRAHKGTCLAKRAARPLGAL